MERVCVGLVGFCITDEFVHNICWTKMANNELFELFSETDDLINNYLRPKTWQGSLPMKCCMIINRDAPLMTGFPGPIDLFDYCKDGMKSTMYRKLLIRFDTTKYPIPEDGGNYFGKGSSGHKLVTDLLSICHRDGKSNYCSYGSHHNKNSRRIACHHFFCHNPTDKDDKKFSDLALRKGKSKSTQQDTSKRTLSGRAECKDVKCGSFFTINVDSCCFYMIVGNGIGKHSNHAPHVMDSVKLPKRLIPVDVIKSCIDLAYCKTSTRSIVEMAKLKFGCSITKRQAAYIVNFEIMAKSINEAGESIGGSMSDPDLMIKYFTDNDIPHIVLSHEKNIDLFEFKGQTLKCIKSEATSNKENEATVNGKENGNTAANSNNENGGIVVNGKENGSNGNTAANSNNENGGIVVNGKDANRNKENEVTVNGKEKGDNDADSNKEN